MAIPIVDRFPRNRYIAAGILACMTTLIGEAALVAEFGSSNNKPALLAAVAMFYIFQIPYGLCLDGKQPLKPHTISALTPTRYPILLPRRNLADAPPLKGHFARRCNNLLH
jgi:hypothetical protein